MRGLSHPGVLVMTHGRVFIADSALPNITVAASPSFVQGLFDNWGIAEGTMGGAVVGAVVESMLEGAGAGAEMGPLGMLVGGAVGGLIGYISAEIAQGQVRLQSN